MDVRLTAVRRASASGLLAVTAQRLLAESLTNALKHGDLSHPVEVEEDWRDGYRLVVRNRVRGRRAGARHRPRAGRDARPGDLAGGTFEAGASDGEPGPSRAALPEPVA